MRFFIQILKQQVETVWWFVIVFYMECAESLSSKAHEKTQCKNGIAESVMSCRSDFEVDNNDNRGRGI